MMEALAIGLAAGMALGFAVGWFAAGVRWKRRWTAREDWVDDATRSLIRARDAEIEALSDHIAAFDHDGDGKPGGSKPRGKG